VEYSVEKIRAALTQLDPALAYTHNNYFLRRVEPLACWDLSTILKTIIPELKLSDPILDLGCGPGTWLLYLWSLKFDAMYGSDHNPQKIRVAKKLAARFNADIRFACQPMFPEDRASFKLVTALGFLYEKAVGLAPYTFLAHAKAILAPGGVVVFDWLVDETAPTHRLYYTIIELLAQLPAGLTCRQVLLRKTANGHTALYTIQHEVK
jgi:SAM-dependent methyltransferase